MRGKGVKSFFKKVYLYRAFLVMLLPAVAYTLIFSYYPMTGIVLAEFGAAPGTGWKTSSFSSPRARRA